MKFVIDTSAISAFGKGADKRLNQWFTSQHELLIPLIVIGELRAGFAYGNQQEHNEQLLQKFLNAPNVSTLTVGYNTTKLYAEIYRRLRQAGKPINTNDMWIAALALEHNCLLVTLDSDFKRVPDLLITQF